MIGFPELVCRGNPERRIALRTGSFSIWECLLGVHYTTLFLFVLFGLKLHAQKKIRDADLRFYWATLICCFLLVVEDVLETWSSYDPALRFWRILFSVTGYILRPTAGVCMLLLVYPPERRTWKLWILWFLNAAVNLTAFFSPLAFTYDAEYAFVRGPLGYVVFIVSFLYLLMILYTVWNRFYERKPAERWILIMCVVGCMGAALVDAFFGRVHLNEALMVACVFLYIFLRSHDNYMDPLTSLRNRFAFYDDTEHLGKSISAIATLDMNGLKRLNDSKGHTEGDRALAAIGNCLSQISSRTVISYRVGGDEFVILFLDQDEETVKSAVRAVRDSVTAAGYSISAGYTMSTGKESLDELMLISDRNMYKDKSEYYQQQGRDRRARPRV